MSAVLTKGDVPKRALVLEGHADGFARLRVQELGCPVVTCRQELVAMRTHAQAVNTTTMPPRFADSLAIHRGLALRPGPQEDVPVNIARGNSIRCDKHRSRNAAGMSDKACDDLMRLQIPQEDDAIVTSPENLLPVGTQGQIMNAVRRRMPPGVNRLFHIAVPDLDFPLGIARYDLAIACEQASPDGAAVWKGANQLMGLRLPEPGTFCLCSS